MMSLIRVVIIMIFSIYACIKDVQTMRITDKLNRNFLLSGLLLLFIDYKREYLIMSIVTFVVLIFIAEFLSGGDIKFLSVLAIYIGHNIISIMGVYCTIALIRYMLGQREKYPAMPDILISIVIILIRVGGEI